MIKPTMLHNRLLYGDSIQLLQRVPDDSVDLILTDPPYLVNYRSRDGRTFQNENPDDTSWLEPAFAEMYRVLKPDSLCLSFYGYSMAHHFLQAFESAGFRVVGHIVFKKHYASGARFTRRTHEQAYLLAKGRPRTPMQPIDDVLPWGKYTGNRLHPCQKPVSIFQPVIEAFTKPGDLILDPFAGSASTAVAAKSLARHYLAIEMDWQYYQKAWRRLNY
jgi:site-specific DNA-methyltransferase (adenine-specific)